MSINDADSALDISIVSRNVMCDNVFATYVEIALQLAGADNCIVSNSHFEQTRESSEREAFIFAEEACNCWVQNSYIDYNGSHRATTSHTRNSYVYNMFADKRHRRMFVGEDFDIPNHWFKFTGCEFKASEEEEYYFANAYNESKAIFHEYWDNCKLNYSAKKDFFRLKCINSIPAGITIRNSYLKNSNDATDIGSPFRFHCGNGNCNCITEDGCPKKQLGKRFPYIHYENNILDRFIYPNASTAWRYHINTYEGETHNFTISEAVKLSGSYVSNVFRFNNGKFSEMSNLM